MVTIFINTQEHEVLKGEMTFSQITTLAFPNLPAGQNVRFKVTFRKAQPPREEGILKPGELVLVKEGTKFNVTVTDKS